MRRPVDDDQPERDDLCGDRRMATPDGRARRHQLLGVALDLVGEVRERLQQIPDVEVMEDELLGKQASRDLDRTQILMDISATGTSGYQAVDWLRENRLFDLGLGDHRRVLATMSFVDDKDTADRLVDAMTA
jgi:arginine decarboxylase